MKKFWSIVSWGLLVIAQLLLSFLLVSIAKTYILPKPVSAVWEFLAYPLSIWLSFILGVFGVGIVGIILLKLEPRRAGLRVLSTSILALIPMVVLIVLGLTVGIENQENFSNIVLGRMVTYYTQLTVVFSLIGFYIPNWFSKIAPKTE
jgi:hypothetical protein